MELGDGRAGGLWGRRREDSSRRHGDTQDPTGAGQCLASSGQSMDACSQEIEAGETEGRSTRRRESGTKRWSETGTQKEERDRTGGGGGSGATERPLRKAGKMNCVSWGQVLS